MNIDPKFILSIYLWTIFQYWTDWGE